MRQYSWNGLAIPSGVNWQAYAGVREAVAVGLRPALMQYWDPANNPTMQKGHLMRQAQDFAMTEVVDALHRKIVIRAGS